ncbi:RsmF rRNA methyltransferase first C-terminal domain-containing protein [Peptacetobacter hiranonis]|uniref:NOL1/NOP2/sun family protein n=1 Tax=Peptacetobacter hiranonis (strain DSM 13275 / JCM 10541 / KCTC 15199 / TO-931) TaxID=500633 RepID=B6G0Y3_PEPHT|nr:RsmF rRNA methyltransferase first C-terminal domain-containing protein [Peptacetobacter hiranonis]EEA84558.1 NOL1/NOP2/sun family protein [Peptacetobacter hiranonis DSM 13275]QEK21619.1 Ribosomal RNA small subunit methyltransferase F [Peptacetobacter hiranonis]
MNLPERFLNDVKELLGDEFDDFIKSYEQKKTTAIRVNTMKMEKDRLKGLLDCNTEDIPWAEEGLYYDEDECKPGRNPLHDSGAYYLQEPSAMSVVPKADIQEGDIVLDMCAAPGGKSTYILSKLNNTGLLVSNEINATRIKALGENLERFGAANAIITNTDSKGLLKVFEGYFDKVIIDAPCSGEGMFRKDQVAIDDWSYAKVIECRDIQHEIIRDGYKMLKNGGTLVYSTCTFAKEEDEDIIDGFAEEFENAEVVLKERLWPHKVKGEGHFVAKIIKHDEEDCSVKPAKFKKLDKELKDFRDFEKKFLNIKLDGDFFIRGENLYLMPKNSPDTKKIKLLRQGLHLGELKKNRFEPSHALAHYLKKEDVKNFADFKFDSDEIKAYMSGDVINTGESRGWIIVGVEGVSLGWGKESGGVIKNRYPKGLRRKIQL